MATLTADPSTAWTQALDEYNVADRVVNSTARTLAYALAGEVSTAAVDYLLSEFREASAELAHAGDVLSDARLALITAR